MKWHSLKNERGDISVFIALLVLSVTLSSALLFTLILTKQLRTTEDVISSERAFYAAATGLERGLYPMSQKDPNLYEVTTAADGTLEYPGLNDVSTFNVEGKLDETTGQVCIEVNGTFRSLQRRFKLGPADCSTEPT